MRVVLDTNVLISACWKADSLEARVIALVEQGRLQAFVTPQVLDEYRRVLYREKFRSRQDCLVALLGRLEQLAHRVTPTERLTVATDDDDNRLLECAAAAGAHFLITGNRKHFPAAHGPTQIVNARLFLEQL